MMQDWNFYRDALMERVGDFAKHTQFPEACLNRLWSKRWAWKELTDGIRGSGV